jgi:hypothetical protein
MNTSASHEPMPSSEHRSHIARFGVYWLLIAVSFLVGWFVPDYYDWTGSNQSQSSPLVAQTALGLVVGAMLIWASLPWLPIAAEVPGTDRSVRIRFTSRTMFLLTAAVAGFIAAGMKFPMVVSGVLGVLAFCYIVWFWKRFRQSRWPTSALVACMWLPFVWVVAWKEIENIVPEMLGLAAGMPAFLPAAFIGRFLLGQDLHDLGWLAILLTGTELVVGTGIIRLGSRRTIAYLVLVLLVSTFSSFVLHALMRA